MKIVCQRLSVGSKNTLKQLILGNFNRFKTHLDQRLNKPIGSINNVNHCQYILLSWLAHNNIGEWQHIREYWLKIFGHLIRLFCLSSARSIVKYIQIYKQSIYNIGVISSKSLGGGDGKVGANFSKSIENYSEKWKISHVVS